MYERDRLGTYPEPRESSVPHPDLSRSSDEERAITRAAWEDIQRKLNDTRAREENLEAQRQQLTVEFDDMTKRSHHFEILYEDWHAHSVNLQAQYDKQSTLIDAAKNENGRLIRRIEDLERERAEICAEVERLGRPAENSALDIFDNTVDQVSVANIKDQGSSSVATINDIVDVFVIELIEQAKTLRQALSQNGPAVKSTSPDRLLSALFTPVADAENQELLLDACLHHLVNRELHTQFFLHDVATVSTEDASSINALYEDLVSRGKLLFLSMAHAYV